QWIIYAILDPKIGDVRYIGVTIIHPWARLDRHIQNSLENRNAKLHQWLLTFEGYPPVIALAKEPNQKEAFQKEQFYIRKYRDYGRLLNRTGATGWKHSKETRMKMSRTQRKNNTRAFVELSKGEIAAIKALYNKGIPQRSIATKFNITQPMVSWMGRAKLKDLIEYGTEY